MGGNVPPQLLESPSEGVAATGLPYSVKLEQTAKEVRVSVHVYGKSLIETAAEAVKLLENVVMNCESKGINVQPLKADSSSETVIAKATKGKI